MLTWALMNIICIKTEKNEIKIQKDEIIINNLTLIHLLIFSQKVIQLFPGLAGLLGMPWARGLLQALLELIAPRVREMCLSNLIRPLYEIVHLRRVSTMTGLKGFNIRKEGFHQRRKMRV